MDSVYIVGGVSLALFLLWWILDIRARRHAKLEALRVHIHQQHEHTRDYLYKLEKRVFQDANAKFEVMMDTVEEIHASMKHEKD